MIIILVIIVLLIIGALGIILLNSVRNQALREQITQLKEREQQQDQALQESQQRLQASQQALATQTAHAQRVPILEQALEAAKQQTLQLTSSEQALKTRLEEMTHYHAEQLALLTHAKEALSTQFKALANDILEEKTKRFTEQNQQQLGGLLQPLQERLQGFGKLVQDTYEKESKERLVLETELKRLQELNTRLNQDAVALTQALTGANNKAQGTWGEMVLEKVLETSGLTKGREYRIQVSDTLDTEQGQKRYQPDVVIDLPEGRHLVVDSKVSLNAYVRYSAQTDKSQQAVELKAHIAAIRQHVRTLSEKRYHDLYQLNSLDFVFLFIPVEPAYLLAVQHDMQLFNEAFERRIMIVGPSTLLATLRTVASIWRYEYQNQNAQEIAKQGGALYDKFAGFVGNMEKLGKGLSSAQETYQQAMKQLSTGRGNLLAHSEKLRRLGISHHKTLPKPLGLSDRDDEEILDEET